MKSALVHVITGSLNVNPIARSLSDWCIWFISNIIKITFDFSDSTNETLVIVLDLYTNFLLTGAAVAQSVDTWLGSWMETGWSSVQDVCVYSSNNGLKISSSSVPTCPNFSGMENERKTKMSWKDQSCPELISLLSAAIYGLHMNA